MSGQRRAVMERVTPQGPFVWHLPAGPTDEAATWTPIRCGGGIQLPGPIQPRPIADICPACRRSPAGEAEKR